MSGYTHFPYDSETDSETDSEDYTSDDDYDADFEGQDIEDFQPPIEPGEYVDYLEEEEGADDDDYSP